MSMHSVAKAAVLRVVPCRAGSGVVGPKRRSAALDGLCA